MPDTSLETAVAEAAAELTKAAGGEATPPEEIVESAEAGGENATDPGVDPEPTEEEKIEARNLYRALKNPATSRAVVAALAEQMGFNAKPAETKAEEKRQVKDVKSILGEALGEYKFLADKLGPAIETILSQEREENEVRFAQQEQYRVEQEVIAATSALAKETKGESTKLEARMNELSNEIPIGNQSVKTYIQRLYTIAAGERQKNTPARVAETIRRNANDATARLQGVRGNDKSVQIPNGKMNINQAVQFAFDQLSGKKG